jgi:hypothetical protein
MRFPWGFAPPEGSLIFKNTLSEFYTSVKRWERLPSFVNISLRHPVGKNYTFNKQPPTSIVRFAVNGVPLQRIVSYQGLFGPANIKA